MYTISRYIIFVPIIILVLSLYIHYSAPEQSSTNPSTIPSLEPQQNTLSRSTAKPASSAIKLDLKGPYKCEYKSNDMQVTAFILNRKVYVQFTQNKETDYVLLNGDCGYKWEKGETAGEKMCGVGTYISLFESLSGMPFFNINSIFSMVGQFAPSVSIAPSQLSSVADSCKKESVDDSVFTIPSTIIFSDIQKVTPSITQ